MSEYLLGLPTRVCLGNRHETWNKTLGKQFFIKNIRFKRTFFFWHYSHFWSTILSNCAQTLPLLQSNVSKEYFTQLILLQKWAICHVGQANTPQLYHLSRLIPLLMCNFLKTLVAASRLICWPWSSKDNRRPKWFLFALLYIV